MTSASTPTRGRFISRFASLTLCVLLAVLVTVPVLGANSANNANKKDAEIQSTTRIDTGELQGLVEDGVAVYRGIPYARAPEGELRFKAPTPPMRWNGPRDATEFGKICPQGPMLAMMLGQPLPETSEDCLFLNVYSTSKTG